MGWGYRLAVLCLSLLGCQLPFALNPEVTPSPTAQSIIITTELLATPEATPTESTFSPIVSTRPSAPTDVSPPPAPNTQKLSRDLALVVNPQHVPLLSDEQRAELLDSGTVVLADEIPDFAEAIVGHSGPIWLNADLVLAYMAKQEQRIWLEIEDEQVTALLLAFYERWAQLSARQWAEAIEQNWETRGTAARRNWVYATVAGRLLDDSFPTPAPIFSDVSDELDLLALGGVYQSPYQGETFDYGRFSGDTRPLTRSMLWANYVPLAAVGDEQTVLLREALQDEQLVSLWERGIQIFPSSAWWTAEEESEPVYLFQGEPAESADVDAESAVVALNSSAPILIEYSAGYGVLATGLREKIELVTAVQVVDDAILDELLSLELFGRQAEQISKRQLEGYQMSVEEQAWIGMATEAVLGTAVAEDVAMQQLLVLTLYEGEQTVFLGWR